MASIFSKRGFLWLGWYELDNKGNKIHPQLNLKLKDTKQNRKAAELFKQQKEIELRTSSHKFIGRVSTDEAILRFMNTKRYKSKNTILIYNYSIVKINELSVKYLRDFSKDDIELLIEKLKSEKKSNETIKTYLRHIKIFFEYCVNENLIATNPVESFKTKSNNVVKIIPDSEIEIILNYFYNRNKKHYYFLALLNSTGLRVSELIDLCWKDINNIKKTILIRNSKGARVEEIPLIGETESILSEIEYTGEKIFDYKNRQSLKAIRTALNNYGYTFHDFRRTFGTRWSKQLKPFELKKIMRHRDIRTTDKYYVHNEIDEIRNKMDGCCLVAESNKKSSKLYRIK